MATDPLAIETAARKAADDALDTRLKAVEAKVGLTPPVVTPPIQPPVTPPVTPPTSGVYGSGLMGDSRGNQVIGGVLKAMLDYRFRSIGGTVASVRFQERGKGGSNPPAYSAGNGGTIKASIQSDANGLPSGNVLTSLQWTPGNPSGDWEVWTLHAFGTPAMLAANGLYHIVVENIAAAPTTNYISLNMLFHFGSTPTPRTAAFSDDFAALYKQDKGWSVVASHVPIFDLAYQDGRHDGQAYIGTLADRFGLINGTANMVRERFTVSGGNRTVSKAHVRLKRISGSGNLVIRLESGNGTVLGQATVPSSSIAVGSMPPGSLQGDTWAHATFPSPIVLTSGQAYALRLSTDAATTYTAVPIQQGTSKGLASRVFGDGDGQRTTDGGANWANLYPYDSVDLQFWLDG